MYVSKVLIFYVILLWKFVNSKTLAQRLQIYKVLKKCAILDKKYFSETTVKVGKYEYYRCPRRHSKFGRLCKFIQILQYKIEFITDFMWICNWRPILRENCK